MNTLLISHVSSGHNSAFYGVLGLARRIAQRIRERRELNGLLKMDDYLLHDIGVQRGDVQMKATRSLWNE